MLHCSVVLPVIRDLLVECCVLLIRDIFGFQHPDGLVLIQLLPAMRHLLHLLFLLFFLFFDFGFVGVLIIGLLLNRLFVFTDGDFLVDCLLNAKLDWERNELAVLLAEMESED